MCQTKVTTCEVDFHGQNNSILLRKQVQELYFEQGYAKNRIAQLLGVSMLRRKLDTVRKPDA